MGLVIHQVLPLPQSAKLAAWPKDGRNKPPNSQVAPPPLPKGWRTPKELVLGSVPTAGRCRP